MKKALLALLLVIDIFITWQPQIENLKEKVMAIAKSTLEFVTKEEGFRSKAYADSKGLMTIGVGHLIKPEESNLKDITLTTEQVEDLLRNDLKWCDEAVNQSIKVPLTQNQYDALYSLCFNIGATHFKESTVVRKINQGDLNGAADAFLMWNKPPELEGRRKRERALFLGQEQ
jgi:lysozyme